MSDEMNRMVNYIKYGLSLKTTSADGREYFLVGINFSKKWQIVEPSPESGVSCVVGNDGESQFYYFAPIECGVNAIFNCIDETIRYNEDVEKKITLLRQRISELQELFAEKPYEWLTNLQFVYQPPKKEKRGRPRKEKTTYEHTTEETVVEDESMEDTESNEIVEETPENEIVEIGNNKEEANEIDKKISALLGK